MTTISREEAKKILTKALSYSKAEGCQVTLQGSTDGNIRYALNQVTTSGEVQDTTLVVAANFGKRSGIATINELDDASLQKVVQRAEEIASLAPENPEFMPVLGPQDYHDVKGYYDATAEISPEFRAKAAADSIGPCRKEKLVAAGFLNHGAGFQATMTSKGLFGYYPETTLDFSVTVRTEDGAGSGYALRDFNDAGQLDTAEVSRIALDKARMSKDAKALEPGRYTVILEPAASMGLLQNLLFSMDARRADEGRSFLSKKEGGSRLGEKIVDERVNIFSDPTHPDIPSAPFAGDGQPREKVNWIENGVIKNLFYSRYWAKKKDKKPMPFPSNAAMEGTNTSLQELIAGTERGVLVTRTWYIRMVDPQSLLATGLTRDGTFFIENGKIAHAVKNFRFNESPVIMLNNLEDLGRPQRIGGNLIPSMKIRDFNFTSLSDAV